MSASQSAQWELQRPEGLVAKDVAASPNTVKTLLVLVLLRVLVSDSLSITYYGRRHLLTSYNLRNVVVVGAWALTHLSDTEKAGNVSAIRPCRHLLQLKNLDSSSLRLHHRQTAVPGLTGT